MTNYYQDEILKEGSEFLSNYFPVLNKHIVFVYITIWYMVINESLQSKAILCQMHFGIKFGASIKTECASGMTYNT